MWWCVAPPRTEMAARQQSTGRARQAPHTAGSLCVPLRPCVRVCARACVRARADKLRSVKGVPLPLHTLARHQPFAGSHPIPFTSCAAAAMPNHPLLPHHGPQAAHGRRWACTHSAEVLRARNGRRRACGGGRAKREDMKTCLLVRCESNGVPPAWDKRCVPPESTVRDTPKAFSVLGSTGSIGTQTLDIIAEHPHKFKLVALAAGSNVSLLAEQVRKFKPKMVSINNSSKLAALKEQIKDVQPQPEILCGQEGAVEVAQHVDAEAVVTGIVGCAGLLPTVAAIKAKKDICLANKETLIAGGPFILPLAREYGVKILPADSEHSAIFQCLQGLPENGLRRIILTASGGAFRDWPVEKLKEVTVEQAITHPNWSMGKKITIDSATLMNKGLEVIEAHYLYGVDYDHIEIVIHPQSIIHSMVETTDSSVLAQLGWPDMRLPIMYTMSWPERIHTSEATWPRLDFMKAQSLTFTAPDNAKYPSMNLSYAAGRTGGTMTGVLSAANEQAVQEFIDGRIGYLDIIKVNDACCEAHKKDWVASPGLDDIVHYDKWAREHVRRGVDDGLPQQVLAAAMPAASAKL